MCIQIVVVDDHPLWRVGVTDILALESTIDVVGEGNSAADAITLAQTLSPDLMLLDVSMPGNGIAAAAEITSLYPAIKLIMLTVSQDDDVVMSALKAGAKGYVLKGVSGKELINVISTVHRGVNYITPALASSLLIESQLKEKRNTDSPCPMSQLNRREMEILSHLSEGLSNREIANVINLSEKTVKHYMTSILQKLKVRNRVEAALFAQRVSLLAD